MAWNVPSVFVAEQQLTAAALNLYLRDNLLETETAKATEAGQLLVTAGPNSVAMRKPIEHSVNEAVTTSSTTPVTLSGGPSVTFTHGGAFWVLFSSRMRVSSGQGGPSDLVYCGPEIVGGQGASVRRSIQHAGNPIVRWSGHFLWSGQPAGSTTVRMRYWVADSALTGEYLARNITVIPF